MAWVESSQKARAVSSGLAVFGAVILGCLTTGNNFVLSCLASSLAMTTFAPLSNTSRPQAVVLSTVLALGISLATTHLIGAFPGNNWFAVLLTMLAMALARTEHPPAAAIPLVLSTQNDVSGATARLLFGACFIAVIAYVLRCLLRDQSVDELPAISAPSRHSHTVPTDEFAP
jgi:hypothetical protein